MQSLKTIRTQRFLNSNRLIYDHPNKQQPQSKAQIQIKVFPILIKNSCRICLQDTGRLINPCLCKGSVMYMHEQCIKQWIKKNKKDKLKINESIDDMMYINCEMCQNPINYKINVTKSCEKTNFLANLKEHPKYTLLQICIVSLLIFATIFLMVSLMDTTSNTGNLKFSGQVLIAFVILEGISLVCLILYGYSFIVENFVSQYRVIEKVLSIEQFHILKYRQKLEMNQVLPMTLFN